MAPTLMASRREDFRVSYCGPVLRSMSKNRKPWNIGESGSQSMTSKKSRGRVSKRAEVNKLFPIIGANTRKPRRLTDLRKRKISAFVYRSSSSPDKYFGELGSKEWISELIKFLNSPGQPRHHAVNPSDICNWLKTSYDFFREEFVRPALSKNMRLNKALDSLLPVSSSSLSSSSSVQTDLGVDDVSGESSNTTIETESDNPAVPAATLTDLNVEMGNDPRTVRDCSVDYQTYWIVPVEPGECMVVDGGDVVAVEQGPVDPDKEPVSYTPPGTGTEEALARFREEFLQEIKEETLGGIKENALEGIKNESLDEIKEEPVSPDLTELRGGGSPTDLSQAKQELEESNLTALVPVPLNVYSTYDFQGQEGDLQPDGHITDPYQWVEPLNGAPAYTVRSDLENIDVDVKEMIESINLFGDATSVLLHLAHTGAFSPDIDNMQVFTTILAKLIEDANRSGLYSETDIDTLSMATKITNTTLKRMRLSQS